MLFSFRSSQIARNSLKLTQRSAQAAYEMSRADPRPAASMYIDEVEYRQSDAVEFEPESELNESPIDKLLKGARRYGLRQLEGLTEDGDFEVVVRGRIVNNVSHELLLTSYYNAPWFGDHGTTTLDMQGIDHVLSPGLTVHFEYVLRRPKRVWVRINKWLTRRQYMECETAGLVVSRSYKVQAAIDLAIDYVLRLGHNRMIERCGFTFVCEPRFAERVATVWRLQVRLSPVELVEGAQGEEPRYIGRVGLLGGPFDDEVIYYRGELDGTLARLEPPKYPHGVADRPGREQ
ncbi:hypothetical protein LX88_006255 [Lentzea californiensis]|nr:hypothetical protein [Lentzea californiensis]